jgi:hypothetical protein
MYNAESIDLDSSSLLMGSNFACEGILLTYSWYDAIVDDDEEEEMKTMTTYFSFSFVDQAMPGLFHPLEEYAGPSILTEGVLRFVFFLGCMIEFLSESVFYFIACDLKFIILAFRLKTFSSFIILAFLIWSFLV